MRTGSIPPVSRSGMALVLGALLFSQYAQAAAVYVQHPPSNAITGPALVSTAGLTYAAEADLQQGTFRATSTATAAASSIYSFTYAGISDLALTNLNASPVPIAAGNFVLQFEGTFAFSPGAAGTSEAGGQGLIVFSAARNCLHSDPACIPAVAGIGLNPGATYFNGAQTGLSDGVLDLTETNGATVNILQANVSGLRADLLMPVALLAPGDFLDIRLDILALATASNFASATTDFWNTARLSLVLPAGLTLSSNAATPLNWVSTVPAPAAVWLLGTGLLGILGLKWQRRPSAC